jgi:hypothetical protein
MNDDASMMLDAEAPADGCGGADGDAAHHLDQLFEDTVDDGPGRPDYPVFDDESRVPKPVHEQCPKAETKQPFPLSLEILEDDVHLVITTMPEKSGTAQD